MKIYVSGPMTGMPEHNYPLFNLVANELRLQGHEVLNPAELDQDLSVDIGSLPWEWYLARDIKAMLVHDTEAVVLLPGWQNSDGAKLEVYIAKKLKMDIYTIDVNTFELTWEVEMA